MLIHLKRNFRATARPREAGRCEPQLLMSDDTAVKSWPRERPSSVLVVLLGWRFDDRRRRPTPKRPTPAPPATAPSPTSSPTAKPAALQVAVTTTAALSLVGCAAVVFHAARIIRKDGHLLQHTALVVVLATINGEATCFALGRAFMARDDDDHDLPHFALRMCRAGRDHAILLAVGLPVDLVLLQFDDAQRARGPRGQAARAGVGVPDAATLLFTAVVAGGISAGPAILGTARPGCGAGSRPLHAIVFATWSTWWCGSCAFTRRLVVGRDVTDRSRRRWRRSSDRLPTIL